MDNRTEGGFSLLECVAAIAIVSTLLLGIISGFLTTTTASSRAGDRAAATAALTELAEQLRAIPYRPCSTLAQLRADAAAMRVPPRVQLEFGDIAHLRADGSFGAACTGGDRGAQRVTLVVSTGAAVVDGEVVRRDPGARP